GGLRGVPRGTGVPGLPISRRGRGVPARESSGAHPRHSAGRPSLRLRLLRGRPHPLHLRGGRARRGAARQPGGGIRDEPHGPRERPGGADPPGRGHRDRRERSTASRVRRHGASERHPPRRRGCLGKDRGRSPFGARTSARRREPTGRTLVSPGSRDPRRRNAREPRAHSGRPETEPRVGDGSLGCARPRPGPVGRARGHLGDRDRDRGNSSPSRRGRRGATLAGRARRRTTGPRARAGAGSPEIGRRVAPRLRQRPHRHFSPTSRSPPRTGRRIGRTVQLRRLRVKNIRSYVSADIDFGAGTTLIAGDVGSGKTSLLYAIEMALFGVAEVDAAYLVRHGAAHAEVSVAFEGPEQRYEIFRRFRRLRRKGRDTFEAERIRFTVNGAETSYSATELRQQVIGLLGFPDNPSPQAHSDLWRWAVYVPQERMRDILGARPQDRLETVRKALGVERYRTAAENAQELATDLRRSAASRRAEADRLRHFDEEFAEGNLQADRLRVDRATLDRALREREANVAALRVARTELESRTRKLEADERELAGLEREQQADHLSLEEVRRVVAERQEEARRRREESSSASADADALETRRGTLAGIDQELSRLRSELDRRSAGLRALAEGRAHVEAADRRVAEAREAVERNRTEEAEARRTNEEALAEGPGKEPPAPTPDTLPKIEERLSEAHGHEATALQAVAQAESSLAEIDELLRAGVCPRCRQPVRPSEYGTHRTEAAAELDATRATLAAVATDRQRWDEERRARERYERALDRWKEVEKRRIAARTVLGRATRSFEGSVRSLETAERSALAARQRVEELSPQESQDSALRAEFSRKEEARAGVVREVESSILAAERR